MKENIIVIEDNAGWADIYACDGYTVYHGNVGEEYADAMISLLNGACPIADGWEGEFAEALEVKEDMKAMIENAYLSANYDVVIDTLPGTDITDLRGTTAWEGLNLAALPGWLEDKLVAKFGESRIYGEG